MEHQRNIGHSLAGRPENLNRSSVAKIKLLVVLVGANLGVGHEDSCFLV